MVSHMVYAVHRGHGLNWGLIADWLTRSRPCKQMLHGPWDVIGFEGILGDTPS